MEKPAHYQFFQNTQCEYFPCHQGIKEEEFSCLFCYCPLYALGHDCGGHFKYLESGVKDCTGCTVPHRIHNYEHITTKVRELIEILKIEELNSRR